MKKSVVIFDGNNRFTWGGGQRITVDLMQALQNSFNLYLIEVGRTPEFFRRASPLAKTSLRLHFPASKAEGQVSFNLNFIDLLIFPIHFVIAYFRTILFLRRHRLNSDNTILYSAAKRSHILCWLLKMSMGFKTVGHLHTLDNKQSWVFPFMNYIQKSFDRVMVVSNSLKSHFNYPQISVVSPAISRIANSARKLPENKPYVIAYVGSLLQIKGVDTFLDSHSCLKCPDDFEFWILGEGAQESDLKKQFGNNPAIKFLGFTDNTWEIMNRSAQVLVLPSRVPESFGLVLIESASFGIPFVTTNLGGANELSKELMDIEGVPVDNKKALAERIESIVNSRDYYERVSQNLLKNVSIYSSQNVNQKILTQFVDI